MTAGDAVHDIHEEHVMVDGYTYLFENGGALVLRGGDLVVAGAEGNTELIGFGFEIAHECIDAFGDAAEIKIFELLALGRSVTEDGATAHDEIGTGIEQTFVNNEVFLLPTEGCGNLADVLVEVMANLYGSLVEGGQAFNSGAL